MKSSFSRALLLHFIGLLLSGDVGAQLVDEKGRIDYGLLRKVIVNGEAVPPTEKSLLAMTAMISQYRLSKAELQAMLQAKQKPSDFGFGRCTGTVLAPEVILTAAHCLAKDQWEDGVHVYIEKKEYRVKSVVLHPQYQKDKMDHDIALVFLTKEVLNPITALLPAPGSLLQGATPLTIVGFGLTSEVGNFDDIMRFVHVIGRENGKKGIFVGGNITICSGDSGGPAYLQEGLRYVVVGVTSTGDCKSIANFIRVSDYVPWIQSEIANFRASRDI